MWQNTNTDILVVTSVLTVLLIHHGYMTAFQPDLFQYVTLNRTDSIRGSNHQNILSVMDMTEVKIMKQPEKLFTNDEFVITILSAPGNFEERKYMRENLTKIGQFVFLVGLGKNPEMQRQMDEEYQLHGDLLQIATQENYKNLSYKTLTGILWASQKLRPKWIIKVDDDIGVDWPRFLSGMRLSTEDFVCHVTLRNRFPERRNWVFHKL
jgi:hypothetical protein